MLIELHLYRLKCDKCDIEAGAYVASASKVGALLPAGWVEKMDDGELTHLCAPCDGREWPVHPQH